MAPTSTAPVGEPTSAEFNGDDFSNNLFSDLAPLLTLFGEQTTMQFMSMSLGWADNIILAMGPLGIITIMICAIRVSGSRTLKAIIGRARESLATAEVELLSSTSKRVCELWDGKSVVRAVGQPERMRELIFCSYGEPDQSEESRILGLASAVEDRFFNVYPRLTRETRKEPEKLARQAPNLTLNLATSPRSTKEVWIWAMVGFILQTTSLVIPALTTYLWKWQKEGGDVPAYGYPCFLSGSLTMIVGLIGCSHIIERKTKEKVFRPGGWSDRRIRQIMRLQRRCNVGDQEFPSCVIFNSPKNSTITTSRLEIEKEDTDSEIWGPDPASPASLSEKYKRVREDCIEEQATILREQESEGHPRNISRWTLLKRLALRAKRIILDKPSEYYWSLLTTISIVITIAGFITQFVGLRALHWSATIIQLGVMLAMTGSRAWVRRGLANTPKVICIKHENEMAWLALYTLALNNANENADPFKITPGSWELYTGYYPSKPWNSSGEFPWDQNTRREWRFNLPDGNPPIAPFTKSICPPSITIEPPNRNKAIQMYRDVHEAMEQPETEWSDRLCKAVKGMMKHLMSTDHIRMKADGAMKTGHLNWTINTVHNPQLTDVDDERICLTIHPLTVGMTRKPDSDWEVDRSVVHSIMSLWAFSWDSKWMYSNKAERPLTRPEMGSKIDYFRILGYLPQSYNEESTVLRWLQLRDRHLISAETGRPIPDGDLRMDDLFRRTHRVMPPTFGSYMWKRPLFGGDTELDPASVAFLVMQGNDIVGRAFALELLSLFLSAIADQIEHIGGSTEPVPDKRSQLTEIPELDAEAEPAHDLWTNTAIEELSRCIVEAELAEDVAEANLFVIPALYCESLLPDALSNDSEGEIEDGAGDSREGSIYDSDAGHDSEGNEDADDGGQLIPSDEDAV